ncbi:MAG: T9SS type A sorting domain-containing protein [candidate division WOR-3 bacterium]|nr:MAG: T9SS type A sorting domain-containing protein [candidate division WOR-3 bacterium]
MKRTALTLLLVPALCLAGVIRVPSEQPTIQSGLNAAVAGDTVLVAPGDYDERLTWPGRDGIVLMSEKGADSTVITASNAGRVLTMNAVNYSFATMVRGFRIADGRQTGSAAGVLCRGTPIFLNNRITDNVALQYETGGGVRADGSPVFGFNLIARDSVQVRGMAGFRYGGGVYCTGSGIFYANVFADNAVFDSLCSGFRYGGALYLAGGAPLVFNNLFLCNAVRMTDGSGFAYGGAVCVDEDASAYIANNTFVGNVCSAHITYGGALYVPYGASKVKNNIMVHDSCHGSGQGGGIASDTDAMVCDYNDVWRNYPNDYYRCTAGPNSLNSDPLFTGAAFGDYCLSQVEAGQVEDSPCLDAGDSLLLTSPLNLDSLIHAWTTRTDSFPDAGTPDIGFHYDVSPFTAVLEEQVRHRQHQGLRLIPNPVTENQVELKGTPGTRLVVYDASGRSVADCRLSVGEGRVLLDISSLAPGVYLVRSDAMQDPGHARLVVQR